MSEQSNLTIDSFKRVLPKKVRLKVTDDMVNSLNGLIQHQDLRENFRDNLLSFTSVMREGKYKLKDYINAVRYVSYKLLQDIDLDAYIKTFPDRYNRLIANGSTQKTIASFATAYKKTQLVQKIFEQTMTPVHILNNDIFQKAIMKQAKLMDDENVSPTVQQKAADSLMNHLKPPETLKMELDVGFKQSSEIDDLRNATDNLVKQQNLLLSSKQATAKTIAHSIIVPKEIEDGEFVNVD